MNKKLGRLINPGLGFYFWVMLSFCLASLLFGQFFLAAAEAAVVLLLYLSYLILRKTRHRQLLRFMQTMPNTVESVSRGEGPFPTAMIRLHDGGIVWVNEQFSEITGFADAMSEQYLGDLLPELSSMRIVSQRIPAEGTFTTPVIRNMSVLLADMDAARKMLQQTLQP